MHSTSGSLTRSPVGAARDPEWPVIDALKLVVELSFDRPLYLAALGHVYGRANRKQDALGVLDKLTQGSDVRYISRFEVALVHMGLDNKEGTFEWLEEAHTQCVTRMRSLREALFDVIRSESRFVDLAQRSGCQYEEYRCSAAALAANIDSDAPRTAIRDWIEIVGRWLVRRWKEPLGFLA